MNNVFCHFSQAFDIVGKREEEGSMQARKEPRSGRLPSAVWKVASGSFENLGYVRIRSMI